jgi:hypothetical protein
MAHAWVDVTYFEQEEFDRLVAQRKAQAAERTKQGARGLRPWISRHARAPFAGAPFARAHFRYRLFAALPIPDV